MPFVLHEVCFVVRFLPPAFWRGVGRVAREGILSSRSAPIRPATTPLVPSPSLSSLHSAAFPSLHSATWSLFTRTSQACQCAQQVYLIWKLTVGKNISTTPLVPSLSLLHSLVSPLAQRNIYGEVLWSRETKDLPPITLCYDQACYEIETMTILTLGDGPSLMVHGGINLLCMKLNKVWTKISGDGAWGDKPLICEI